MKHGSISIQGTTIRVSAPPHVSIRLRRLFGGAQRYKAGQFDLAATPEHAYDLEWFRDRHPLDIEPGSEARFRELCAEHERKLEAIAAIDVEGYVPREFELALPLREYQRVAADLALRTGNLLICDSIGLGKTATTIGILASPGSLPALVVTMTHLARQWEREIARFAPKLRVHRIRSTQPYSFRDVRVEVDPTTKRRRVVHYDGVPDVLLITYSKLHGWVEHLSGVVRCVAYDEAQEFRHGGTRKYKAGKAIAEAADLRVGLSVGPGTRLEMQGSVFRTGWSGPIEAAWKMVSPLAKTRRDGGYEIIDLPGDVQCRGWNGESFCWKTALRLIRHRATKPMSRIKAAGVATDLTDDHSVYVVDDDGVSSERVDGLVANKHVIPVDNGAGWSTGSERPFDVLAFAKDLPRSKVTVSLDGFTRRDLEMTPSQWQKSRRKHPYGDRLPTEMFLRNAHRIQHRGLVYIGRGRAPALPMELMLSRWAYVLGFFVGDGWATKHRVAFAVDQPRVPEFFDRLLAMGIGLRPEIKQMPGKSSEIRCSHMLLARVLQRLFGGAKCYDKRIPQEWIFTWDSESRRKLLDGLIDSDGHRVPGGTGRARVYVTTSPGLAEDIRLLTRSLGLNSSITTGPPRAGGTINGRIIVGRRDRISVNWTDSWMAAVDSRKSSDHRRYPQWASVMNQAPLREVSEIDADQESFVYDVEMTGHPSFVANGMLCHNTATPIYGFGHEIFNVMEVIAPGQLGTSREFIDEWCGGAMDSNGKSKVMDPAALGSYLRESGLLIRRQRSDVGRELPPLSVVRHEVECDTDYLDKATDDVAELARRVLDRVGTPQDMMRTAGELDWKLRQATGIAKAGAVAELIRLLVESGERPVVFSWHHEVHRILQDAMTRWSITSTLYTGQQSERQKDDARQAFISGAAKVIIISLRSGAGLDGLQHVSRTPVIAELDWSPQVIEQCIGRIYRDGQPDPVTAYVPVADQGSDPVISDVLGIKSAQSHYLLNPDDPGMPEFAGASDDRIRKLAEDVLRRRGKAA